MSREIKFRAHHKPSAKMYWFDLLWGNSDRGVGYIGMIPVGEERKYDKGFLRPDNRIPINASDCEIMQYTGLKDRNEKDWYDGDLVRVNENSPIHLTYWSEQEMGWRIRLVDGITAWNINAPLFEIIGNLHENPELLKPEI